MIKLYCFIILSFILLIAGCSEDNPATPPVTGEVLLAEVSGDSIGVSSGLASRSLSITGNTLNFTDRDSARFTFYYSGENNNALIPFLIKTTDGVIIYNFENLNPSTTEQFKDITIASPRINAFCQYQITTSSSPGFSFFKFRDLKVFKK